MKNKNHLTEIQRYQIASLLQAGHSQKEISALLFKDKSVISRELKRNISKRGVYLAGHAQRLSDDVRSVSDVLVGLPRRSRSEFFPIFKTNNGLPARSWGLRVKKVARW